MALQNFLFMTLRRDERMVKAHTDIYDLGVKIGEENINNQQIKEILDKNNIKKEELDWENAEASVMPATPANVAYTAIEDAVAKKLIK